MPLQAACLRGEGGIRTPDAGITDVTVFETAAFNHSATSPWQSVSTWSRPFNHSPPPRSCPTTLYLDLQFIPAAQIISLPAYEPRPAISTSRDKSPANACILCGEIGPDGFAGRLRNINHEPQESSVCLPLRAGDATLVREADRATISAVHRGFARKVSGRSCS